HGEGDRRTPAQSVATTVPAKGISTLRPENGCREPAGARTDAGLPDRDQVVQRTPRSAAQVLTVPGRPSVEQGAFRDLPSHSVRFSGSKSCTHARPGLRGRQCPDEEWNPLLRRAAENRNADSRRRTVRLPEFRPVEGGKTISATDDRPASH